VPTARGKKRGHEARSIRALRPSLKLRQAGMEQIFFMSFVGKCGIQGQR
jgi:hypothetical protein